MVSVRYADSLDLSAAILTPDLRIESERAAAQLTGTFSQFRDGGWSAQGTTSGSLFTPTRRSLLGELAGLAGGSTHQDGTKTGHVIANLRVHGMRAQAGLFGGAGAGLTWDGSAWRRLLLGEVGGWLQNGLATGLVTLTPVAVNDSIRYVDGQVALSRVAGALELSLLAGARAGSQIPGVTTQTRSWASGSAVMRVLPRLALVASGGTYPVDPTQGFPGGRFLSVTVRFLTSDNGRRGPQIPAAVSEPVTPEAATGVESFEADRQTAGTVALRVRAPGADSVEITGDFTGWSPVRLERTSEGVWAGSFSLPPGQYQMNLRINGGSWLVPPGLLSLKDEFGGSVGLLVVE